MTLNLACFERTLRTTTARQCTVMRREDDGRTPLREVIALMRLTPSKEGATPAKAAQGRKPAKAIEPCKLP